MSGDEEFRNAITSEITYDVKLTRIGIRPLPGEL